MSIDPVFITPVCALFLWHLGVSDMETTTRMALFRPSHIDPSLSPVSFKDHIDLLYGIFDSSSDAAAASGTEVFISRKYTIVL